MQEVLLFFILISSPDEMIANIENPVQTGFGTYTPYPVQTTPSCTLVTILPDFANVKNYPESLLTPAEESLLYNNGFVVVPSSYKEFYDIYKFINSRELDVFLTVDAMLHTYHRMYEYILKDCEISYFYNNIAILTDSLLNRMEDAYENNVGEVKESAKTALAYFSVAKKLLDESFTVNSDVKEIVDQEINNIMNHSEKKVSPIFNYREDYTQYVPRGHYTDTLILEKYFRVMMWYGRMSFILNSEELTLSALIITHEFFNIENGEELWKEIYLPTTFFVGKSDDISIEEYYRIAKEVYGENFKDYSLTYISDNILLTQFINKAKEELPDPEIYDTNEGTRKGLKFMGQRFIPDSYIFQNLVSTKVLGRDLPKGLDVMSVLGSNRAYEILDTLYKETDYPGYEENMDSLKIEFSSFSDSIWASNLYWNWLYTLMPLLFEKGEGFPYFTRTTAWQDKELNTALGSWTELRHDCVLYGKESYTGYGGYEDKNTGYVEPNPWAFSRLASLVDLTYTGLENLNLLKDVVKDRLLTFRDDLLVLKGIAEKELNNEELTENDIGEILNISRLLLRYIDFSEDGFPGTIGEPWGDDEAPIVTDVHTGLYGSCLEEGIGYPSFIYVIAEINGELYFTRGAVFSYFEFTQPIAERLTDQAWKEMLKTDPPLPPEWTVSFLDRNNFQAVSNPEHAEEQDHIRGIREHTNPAELWIRNKTIILQNNKVELTIPQTYIDKDELCIEVVDITGKTLYNIKRNNFTKQKNKITIDLSDLNLNSGIFYIVIKTENTNVTNRMIYIK